MSQKFGISQTTICYWENGTSEPRDEQYPGVLKWIEGVENRGDAAPAPGLEDSANNLQTADGDEGPTPPIESNNHAPATKGTSDDDDILRLVPADGSAVGNLLLIKKLEPRGWSADRYWRVRDRLLDAGILIKGRGRGGTVRRRVSDSPDQPTTSSGSRVPATEVALYTPLLKVLQGEWARDMRIAPHQIHFEETAKQGKKATGGTWTRPDITAVSVRSFPHLPNKYLDVWTFGCVFRPS
jgi:hypothetical protein